MLMSAREAALKALSAYRRNGARTENFLSNLAVKENMEQRETSLAFRICYGVMQNTALCDFYISSFSSISLNKIEPMVLDILRISVYQIVFLSKIPNSAAVNEGAALTKKYSNNRAVGFVNAVLRKITANCDNLPKIPLKDEVAYLSIMYSHPVWLVREFLNELGFEGCKQLLEANNSIPPVTFRVNTLKTDTKSVLEKIKSEGVSASAHPWIADCIESSDTGNPDLLSAFKDGDVFVQDPAARLAVAAAEPKPGMTVIDVCSAPGGKAFSAAIDMKNTGKILSFDIHEKKLGLINSGAKRLGIKITETYAADGRIYNERLKNIADIVLTDVPCSGLGIIRKKPDIRYKNESELYNLPAIQLDILKNAAKYVKPGGVLIYSTCTLLKRENEEVVNRFLAGNSEFIADGFVLPEPVGRVESGMLTLWPHTNGTDGFFIGRIKRKE